MTNVPIAEAQSRLSELIHQLFPGEELLITENDQPVARLVSVIAPKSQRKLGTLRGTVLRMSPDFDAAFDDVKDYMQ